MKDGVTTERPITFYIIVTDGEAHSEFSGRCSHHNRYTCTLLPLTSDETDYFAAERTEFQILPGQTSVQYSITIVTDDLTEEDETFTLNVQADQSRVSPSPDFGQAIVTITEEIRMYLIMLIYTFWSHELRKCVIIMQIGITVGFDQDMYKVTESTTSVPVCLSILDGILASDKVATVMLESIDGTATGNLKNSGKNYIM